MNGAVRAARDGHCPTVGASATLGKRFQTSVPGYEFGGKDISKVRLEDEVFVDSAEIGHWHAGRRSVPGKRRRPLLPTFRCRLPERGVPDPYSGGSDEFEQVLDLVEEASEGCSTTYANDTSGRA